MSSEYLIPTRDDLVGEKINIFGFPELDITYVSYQNNLCESNYNPDVRCFWEGDLSVDLLVNGKLITINDHDQKKGDINRVNNFIFQGIGNEVKNGSRDETYLKFKITKRVY